MGAAARLRIGLSVVRVTCGGVRSDICAVAALDVGLCDRKSDGSGCLRFASLHLDALGVERDRLSAALETRFGYNCLSTFDAMLALEK